MATAAVTNTFTNDTNADATEVNANFTDLVNFANNSTIHKDASVAFTGVPSGPATDPSADNHLARKAYVDGLALQRRVYITRAAAQTVGENANALITFTAETEDTHGFVAVSSDTITIPTASGGLYAARFGTTISGADTTGSYVILEVSGGTMWETVATATPSLWWLPAATTVKLRAYGPRTAVGGSGTADFTNTYVELVRVG